MSAAGTVFVVDDDAAFRNSLRALFAAAGLAVVTYSNSREFLGAFDDRSTGCLVLDVKLRGESGLDLLDELQRRRASIPVVVLTAHGSVPVSVRAMKSGAIDVVEKRTPPVRLLGRVRGALELAAHRHEMESVRALVEQRTARLTPREMQVAELLVSGRRSKEIATSLGVSYRTVEGYRSKLLEKMQVKSSTELVAALLHTHLIR